MSKSTFKNISKFKNVEKQIDLKYNDDKVYHQYILYVYNGDNEDTIFDDLISCLDKVPSKYKELENYIYCDKCYILELNSYIIKNNNVTVVNNYKIKFGLIYK